MSHEEYAYAVAAVRIKENSLLSPDFLEQLLSGASYKSVRQKLIEQGWLSDRSENDDEQLNKRLIDSYEFLTEVSPHPELLNALVLKNDFHNLKAALKSGFAGVEPDRYYIKPCLYDVAEMAAAVSERRFDKLPPPLIEAAQRAHSVFINTQDGQYTDVIIDTACLEAIRAAGQNSQNPLIDRAAELAVVSANIKTAIRAARTNKDMHFLENAICECETLDKPSLIAAALRGTDALYAYLDSTPYKDAVGNRDGGLLSRLEKWFDDRLMELARTAKYLFFGPEPLAAYYIAKETELRNIRILLSGKRHGAEDTVIRERMRILYV